MKIEVIKKEKNDLEIVLENATVAEIIRVYLNKQGVEFAAWRREHPTKPVLLKVKGGKADVTSAISTIKKDLGKILALVKK